MNAVLKKISGVLQILKNTIEKKISGVLQIMHLELTFSREQKNKDPAWPDTGRVDL